MNPTLELGHKRVPRLPTSSSKFRAEVTSLSEDASPRACSVLRKIKTSTVEHEKGRNHIWLTHPGERILPNVRMRLSMVLSWSNSH